MNLQESIRNDLNKIDETPGQTIYTLYIQGLGWDDENEYIAYSTHASEKGAKDAMKNFCLENDDYEPCNNYEIRKSTLEEDITAEIVTEEQSNIYNVKVTSSHTGYVEITAESEDEAIDEALQYAYKYSVDYHPEEDITAEIVNDDSINEADDEGMSKEKEEQMHELLVFIIQTLDHEFYTEIQSTDNPIGLIRHKVDQVLNHSS